MVECQSIELEAVCHVSLFKISSEVNKHIEVLELYSFHQQTNYIPPSACFHWNARPICLETHGQLSELVPENNNKVISLQEANSSSAVMEYCFRQTVVSAMGIFDSWKLNEVWWAVKNNTALKCKSNWKTRQMDIYGTEAKFACGINRIYSAHITQWKPMYRYSK